MTVLLVLFHLLNWTGLSQQDGYKDIFGEHYESACRFIDHNRWISDSLLRYNTDPCIGLSVIFPELIRYSSIRDKLEIKALQTLYVQYGRAYADFSIGNFQMKPSFAEDLEKEYIRQHGMQDNLCSGIDTTSSEQARKERMDRLVRLPVQVRYLAMFLIIMDQKFSVAPFIDITDRLMLMAAAFNHGFKSDLSVLSGIAGQNFFYTGMIPARTKFNYADISSDYFSKCRNRK
jgi:hypothetical protein